MQILLFLQTYFENYCGKYSFSKEKLFQLHYLHVSRSIIKEDRIVKEDNIHDNFIKTRYSNQGRFIFSEIRGQVVLIGKGIVLK